MVQQNIFCRDKLIDKAISTNEEWDVIVIGGGATGLGSAVEAASRGYRTLLLEQHDFGKGTSSRSTKLVHGGVRYLRQGNLSLVFKALRERGIFLKNAPHLAHQLEFVIPCYTFWEKAFYGIGLKIYDLISGSLGLQHSRILGRNDVLKRLPGIEPEALCGGVSYFDGQFDDSRMIVNLAQTCSDHGGVPINYFQVVQLTRTNGKTDGVVARDMESGREYGFKSKSVLNATGVFADQLRHLDDPIQSPMIKPSQGIHLILDRSFLPGDVALMVPHTDDGRVLFAIPWHNNVIIGTTDTPVQDIELEPQAHEDEVKYLLTHAGRYLTKRPKASDVLSVYAGLRPLVSSGTSDTKSISRDHVLFVSESGLVTITGGKWTTYRQMGEEAVDQAAKVGGLDARKSRTRNLKIHGAEGFFSSDEHYGIFGSDAESVKNVVESEPSGSEQIHPRLPYSKGEVVYSVRYEMARSVEDILARRTNALFLDASASIEAAHVVAVIVARELGRDDSWVERQISQFSTLAAGYQISDAVSREVNPAPSSS